MAAVSDGAGEMTKLYDFHSLNELAKKLRRSKASLHVLDSAGDPFNCGSPAQTEAAKWFADLWHQYMQPGGHLRRFHYKLVVLANTPMLGGGTYVNNDYCYAVLNRVSQWARYLDMVSIDDIVDRRNPAAHLFLSDPEDAEVFVSNSTAWSGGAMPSFPELPSLRLSPPTVVQRYHTEVWVEKSDVEDVVLPIARRHEFNYLPFIGQPSISACRDLVDRAERSGRPVRILYISDFDPQGQSMPVAVARKIEFILAKRGLDLDIEVRPLVLTKDQCIEFALPRTPIKETDALKGAFEKRHGEGATELDALEAIHPGVLRELIMAEVERYHDYGLQGRVDAEESRISAGLQAVTQQCVGNPHRVGR
jgi:hypothetical protein